MNLRRFIDTGEWTTRRYLALLGSVLIWGIVAIDAWYLWPASLGGSTSMVIVSGNSMEPNYFTGDLVIARKADPSVGDVIVYAPEGLGGSQIVHRIIGGDATEGWQLQGDNNDFVDPFTPKGDEVKGVVMVHYANFGRVTVLLLNPVVWGFLLLIAVVLLVWWSGDTCEDDEVDDDDDDHQDVDSGDNEVAPAHSVRTPALISAGDTLRAAESAPRKVSRAIAASAVCLLAFGVSASPASASQLTVNTAGSAATMSYSHCAAQTLTATMSGAASGGTYSSVALAGIAAPCQNVPTSVTLFSASGAQLATGAFTPTAASATVATGSFAAANVSTVVVTVNGWHFLATWSGPVATSGISCLPVNGGGKVMTSPGQSCTVNVTSKSSWISYPGAWGVGAPYYHYSFGFNVTSSQNQWEITIDFSNPNDFPLYNSVPVYVGSGYNVVRAPGYACSSLPIFKGRKQAGNVSGQNNAVMYFTSAPGNTNGTTALCPLP